MAERFVDNKTPLDAITLNKFETELKAYADNSGGKNLYVHNVQIMQGDGITKMIGLLTVYTHSNQQLNSADKLAAALGVTTVDNIAMGGRYDVLGGSYRYYNLTSSAFVRPSSITLRGYQIGFSDSTSGIVTNLEGSGTLAITDMVTLVS